MSLYIYIHILSLSLFLFLFLFFPLSFSVFMSLGGVTAYFLGGVSAMCLWRFIRFFLAVIRFRTFVTRNIFSNSCRRWHPAAPTVSTRDTHTHMQRQTQSQESMEPSHSSLLQDGLKDKYLEMYLPRNIPRKKQS